MKYRLASSALRDIEAIASYVTEQAGETLADKVMARLSDAFERLCEQPRIGRVRADLASPAHRFWLEEPYVIVYVADENCIHIIRVLHGARDLGPLLDDLSA